MTRDEVDRILDVREALERVVAYRALVHPAEPTGQEGVLLDAILYNLVILGEAVRCLPDTFRASETAVPWRDIIGFRNLAAHEYFRVEPQQVWEIVDLHLPSLQEAIARIADAAGAEPSTAGG